MTRRNQLPAVEELDEAFVCCPEQGLLWHRRKLRQAPDGPILRVSTGGYRTVGYRRKIYFQHRVIWKLVTGQEPPEFIDHANRDRADNRWDNLREADRVTNAWNSNPRSHNRSGYRGVTFHKAQRVWQANIKFDGVRHYLGHFDTAEEAAAAFDAVAAEVSRGFYTPQTIQEHPGAAANAS